MGACFSYCRCHVHCLKPHRHTTSASLQLNFFPQNIKSRQRLPLNLQDSEVSVSRGRSLRIQTRMCSRPCRMLLRHNALRSSAGTARKLLPFFYPRILPDGPPIPGPLTRCEFSTARHRNPINPHLELKKMLATFRGAHGPSFVANCRGSENTVPSIRILPDGPPIPGPLTRCEFSTARHRNPINPHPELKKMLATFRAAHGPSFVAN